MVMGRRFDTRSNRASDLGVVGRAEGIVCWTMPVDLHDLAGSTSVEGGGKRSWGTGSGSLAFRKVGGGGGLIHLLFPKKGGGSGWLLPKLGN